MGGGSQKTVEYQKTDPWAGQQPYLKKAFAEAESIYDANKGKMPLYEGEFVYTPNAQQEQFANQGLSNVMGQGQNAVNTTYNASQAMLGGGMAGQAGALGGLFGMATGDPTQANIATAGQYAANPYLDSAIDAANRDVKRQLGEQALPEIDRQAAATGNMNSTRAGVAAGVAQRGAAETMADTAAQMRYGAYSDGLKMAQQDAANRLSAMQSAGGLASDMASTGLGGMGQGMEMANTNMSMGNLFNALINEQGQAKLDNEMARAEFEFNQPWANLQNAWGVWGDKPWGSEGYSISKTKTQPSALSSVATVVGTLGSLFKGCDIRIKKNIKLIGVYPTGFNKYEFEYKFAPGEIQQGPMAQEVELSMPEAVIEVGGIKLVNMTMVEGK